MLTPEMHDKSRVGDGIFRFIKNTMMGDYYTIMARKKRETLTMSRNHFRKQPTY